MTDDPKPCPFCGREPWLQAQQGDNPEPFAWDVVHHCRDGFIRFDPRDRNYRSTKAEAIAAWNTRHEPSAQEAALSQNDLYYLRAISRRLDEFQSAMDGLDALTIGGEALADERDWIECFIDQHTRTIAEKDTPNDR